MQSVPSSSLKTIDRRSSGIYIYLNNKSKDQLMAQNSYIDKRQGPLRCYILPSVSLIKGHC